MKNRKKLNTVRISATLPQEMVEDFKAKAEASGVSVSRLIYLRLRTRKPILVVSQELLLDVKALRQVINKIVAKGSVDAETVELLQRQVRFYEALVDTEREVEVYVP